MSNVFQQQILIFVQSYANAEATIKSKKTVKKVFESVQINKNNTQ